MCIEQSEDISSLGTSETIMSSMSSPSSSTSSSLEDMSFDSSSSNQEILQAKYLKQHTSKVREEASFQRHSKLSIFHLTLIVCFIS